MDGLARVTVDKYVMEYIMHCMYDTFQKIQKGIQVSISWHREDDTVMITSTSRNATRDLHQALNRFFVLYNTLKRNLISKYYYIGKSPERNLYIVNRLRERYRRIHIQNTNNPGEIKLWGFKSELEQALEYIHKSLETFERRLETPDFVIETPKKKTWVKHIEETIPHLPPLQLPRETSSRGRSRRLPSYSPEFLEDPHVIDNPISREPTDILFSKSFERKLSNVKSRLKNEKGQKQSPPSRYSTSEMKRILGQNRQPKKLSTFPKISPEKKKAFHVSKNAASEVQSPTGLTISCCVYDGSTSESGDAFVAEISPLGKLSDGMSWMVAKNKCFEIIKIIKLHVSLYGEMTPSKVIVTPGFILPYKHIVHVCPPSWEVTNTKKCLKNLLNTYKNVLRVADRDMKAGILSIPIFGRCSTAGTVFPEHIALSILNQSIVSSTKFGFRNLRHIRILCSRKSELDYVKTTLFNQILAVKYDPRYLQQQRQYFRDDGEFKHQNYRDEMYDLETL